jgi:hypothetical protein
VERQGVGEKVEISGTDGGPIELAALTPEQQTARLAEISREIRRRLENSPASAAARDLALEEDRDLEDEP